MTTVLCGVIAYSVFPEGWIPCIRKEHYRAVSIEYLRGPGHRRSVAMTNATARAHGPRDLQCVRTQSSRPGQAASTMASTFAKPAASP